MAANRPRASPQLVEHRPPFDPFEYQCIRGHLQDARHRIPVVVRMPHDESLSLRIATGPKAAQDASVAEIEDLRGASGGDELHAPAPQSGSSGTDGRW